MQAFRKTGHNVIQLIYPLRLLKKKSDETTIKDIFTEASDEWKEIYNSQNDVSIEKQHEQNIDYIFPEAYKTAPDSLREWVSNEQIYNYFHPSVQQTLFHGSEKKLRVYRKEMENKRFIGEFYKRDQPEGIPPVIFEWTSSEVYIFSRESAFLVVRISLLENFKVENELMYEENHPVVSLEVWMKFLNRVRQNYEKYKEQESLKVKSIHDEDAVEHRFAEYVKRMFEESNLPLIISSIDVISTGIDSNKHKQLVEPNTYVHAFVQTDFSKYSLSSSELYQATLIDDYDGESGGSKEFKERFIQGHIYDRWAPYTYYTSIDYGAVGIASTSNTCYSSKLDFDFDSETDFAFPDLMFQHHSRQYLILILLQLYYRDELQEIMGRYARLEGFEKELKVPREILRDFYNLNQHFFFDRITHEIQGMEMWKFYAKTLGTKELYNAVQLDMRELNQRLIEEMSRRQQKEAEKQSIASEKQNFEVGRLTVLAALTGMFGMNLVITRGDQNAFYSWIFKLDFLGFPILFNIIAAILTFMTIIIIGYITRYSFYWINKERKNGNLFPWRRKKKNKNGDKN